jgi:glycosyltransferase involved in cell wall biosynthesis
MNVLVIAGYSRSLLLFREALLRELGERGCRVTACAAEDDAETSERLRSLHVDYHSARLQRAGTNPLRDLVYLYDLVRLMRQCRPDIVLAYTHKPILFGTLAAALCRVPAMFSMVTGLGYAFIGAQGARQWFIRRLVEVLYKLAARGNRTVFFLNSDDRDEFLARGILAAGIRTVIVNGEGVDLSFFGPAPPVEDPPAFLLIARLLKDKGIVEFAEAARLVRAQHERARFHLVGPLDPNPAALSLETVLNWQREGVLTYHEEVYDVRPYLAQCSVYVLPSYREGTPHTVLQAMAMGRPVITTDAPGCRDTVLCSAAALERLRAARPGSASIVEGLNGFLVPVRNVEALAAAMECFIHKPALVSTMGLQSRAIAAQRYDVRLVNAELLAEMGIAPRPTG